MKVFIVVFILFAVGAVWGGVSCDWEADDDEDSYSVRSGSRGHGRSYSHGGKY